MKYIINIMQTLYTAKRIQWKCAGAQHINLWSGIITNLYFFFSWIFFRSFIFLFVSDHSSAAYFCARVYVCVQVISFSLSLCLSIAQLSFFLFLTCHLFSFLFLFLFPFSQPQLIGQSIGRSVFRSFGLGVNKCIFF